MNCEHSGRCEFLKHMLKTDSLTVHTVRITYCDHDKYGCARYGLYEAVGADDVPDFLWPNDEEGALEVISIKERSDNRGRNLVTSEFADPP